MLPQSYQTTKDTKGTKKYSHKKITAYGQDLLSQNILRVLRVLRGYNKDRSQTFKRTVSHCPRAEMSA